MTLAELQTKFQAGILENDRTVLASIAESRKTDRATLFAVYHEAYRLRLAEFLSNDFPVLRVHIGEEAFGRLVQDYIKSAPSRQANARWYGTRLPDFMQETAPWRRNRSAIDLARFERALSDAFDAADAPVTAINALRDICVEDWPRLVFEFHPSVRSSRSRRRNRADLCGSRRGGRAAGHPARRGSDHLLAERRQVLLSPCRGRRTPGVDGGKAGQEFRRYLRASRFPEIQRRRDAAGRGLPLAMVRRRPRHAIVESGLSPVVRAKSVPASRAAASLSTCDEETENLYCLVNCATV